MMRERMSRPSSSLPNQCAAEGGSRRVGRLIAAGSWGAIQGAKIANSTKIDTNTTPVAARGLWRAGRRDEMAGGDITTKSLLQSALRTDRRESREGFTLAARAPRPKLFLPRLVNLTSPGTSARKAFCRA